MGPQNCDCDRMCSLGVVCCSVLSRCLRVVAYFCYATRLSSACEPGIHCAAVWGIVESWEVRWVHTVAAAFSVGRTHLSCIDGSHSLICLGLLTITANWVIGKLWTKIRDRHPPLMIVRPKAALSGESAFVRLGQSSADCVSLQPGHCQDSLKSSVRVYKGRMSIALGLFLWLFLK